ncbi:MAG: hypothetical protein ACK55I_20345, partial [bacterium]
LEGRTRQHRDPQSEEADDGSKQQDDGMAGHVCSSGFSPCLEIVERAEARTTNLLGRTDQLHPFAHDVGVLDVVGLLDGGDGDAILGREAVKGFAGGKSVRLGWGLRRSGLRRGFFGGGLLRRGFGRGRSLGETLGHLARCGNGVGLRERFGLRLRDDLFRLGFRLRLG